MKYLLSCDLKSNGVNEHVIIELQGSLEVKDGGNFSNQTFGHLFFSKIDQPTLIIGHHILTGKVIDLDEPLLITKRSILKSDEDRDPLKKFDVIAIVKRKLLFNTRPKPIIVNTLKQV